MSSYPDTHSSSPDALTRMSDPQSQHANPSPFSSLPPDLPPRTTTSSQPAPRRSSSKDDWSFFDRKRELNAQRWKERRARKAALLQASLASASSGSQSSSSGSSSLGLILGQLSLDTGQGFTSDSRQAAHPTPAQRPTTVFLGEESSRLLGDERAEEPSYPSRQVFFRPTVTPSLPMPPPVPSPVGASVELDVDDDEAFLRQLMAQAVQMQQPTSASRPVAPNTQQGGTHGPAPENGPGTSSQDSEPAAIAAATTPPQLDNGKARALEYIEDLFMGFLEEMANNVLESNRREMNPATRKSKSKSVKRKLDDDDEDQEGQADGEESQESQESGVRADGIDITLKSRNNGDERVLHFPEDPLRENAEPVLLKQTRVLRVVGCLYEALLTDCVTTKRDIYYKDVQLYGNQRIVDSLVDDIVASAGLRRQDFNVCATSKGLIASPVLSVHLKSGEQLALSATNAALIPPIERIAKVEASRTINWVLIVEKDAVFTTLLGLKLLDHPDVGHGVIITGKGQPDLATRQLCRLIADTYPNAPLYGLVDADPHGIDILQVYRRGSRSNQHSRDHLGLGLGDRLQWLGVKASQWIQWGVRHNDLLDLSEGDVRLAMSMLKRPDMPQECKRELQNILHLNRKAEIQIISSSAPADTLTQSLFGTSSSQPPGVVSPVATAAERKGGLLEYVVAGLRRGGYVQPNSESR